MTDPIAHRLELLVREITAERHDVDPPDVELYRSLMASLDRDRLQLQRQDALRLEELIERRTGVRR